MEEEYHSVQLKHQEILEPFMKKRGDLLAKISNFWLFALQDHDDVANYVSDDLTVKAMHSCTHIEFSTPKDVVKGFTMTMVFLFH